MAESCRCGRDAIAKGKCHACYEYQRRTGTARPETKIIAREWRLLEGKKR